jgi:hypothetical protein
LLGEEQAGKKAAAQSQDKQQEASKLIDSASDPGRSWLGLKKGGRPDLLRICETLATHMKTPP